NKKLDVSLEVKRSDLVPGEVETWKITVKDYQGTAAHAEILASMYDASLDALVPPSSWKLEFNTFRPVYFHWIAPGDLHPLGGSIVKSVYPTGNFRHRSFYRLHPGLFSFGEIYYGLA